MIICIEYISYIIKQKTPTERCNTRCDRWWWRNKEIQPGGFLTHTFLMEQRRGCSEPALVLCFVSEQRRDSQSRYCELNTFTLPVWRKGVGKPRNWRAQHWQTGQLVRLLQLENFLIVGILHVDDNFSVFRQLNHLRGDVNSSNIILAGPFSHLGTEAAVARKPELVLGHHRDLPGGVPLQGDGLHHDAGRHGHPVCPLPPSGPGPRPRPTEVTPRPRPCPRISSVSGGRSRPPPGRRPLPLPSLPCPAGGAGARPRGRSCSQWGRNWATSWAWGFSALLWRREPGPPRLVIFIWLPDDLSRWRRLLGLLVADWWFLLLLRTFLSSSFVPKLVENFSFLLLCFFNNFIGFVQLLSCNLFFLFELHARFDNLVDFIKNWNLLHVLRALRGAVGGGPFSGLVCLVLVVSRLLLLHHVLHAELRGNIVQLCSE